MEKDVQDAIRNDLKNKCEKLLVGREKHLISSNHFAFKIIDTLKRLDYSRASVKQNMIIESALKELDVNTKAEMQKANSMTKFDNIVDVDATQTSQEMPNIFDVASMLGGGLIGKL